MNWYALGFSRFADRWLLPTPGEIVPGASKDIEPVYQFAPHETELMFRQAEEIMRLWHCWYPHLREVPLETDGFDTRPAPHCSRSFHSSAQPRLEFSPAA